MYCINCGNPHEDGNYCPTCGFKHKKPERPKKKYFKKPFLILSAFILAIGFLIQNEIVAPPVNEVDVEDYASSDQQTQSSNTDEKKSMDTLVNEAKKTVFTITSREAQGTAFLFDNAGHLVTNAHVVEGEEYMDVKGLNGKKYKGEIIGYSKEDDVAMLEVDDLKGMEPFPIEVSDVGKVNDSIIAIGSPNGREGTVSYGEIQKLGQSVMVDDIYYTGMYQMTAKIDSGSSGGPLISEKEQKIIGINTAKGLDSKHVNFSIPIAEIKDDLYDWIDEPMTGREIVEEYNEDWLYENR